MKRSDYYVLTYDPDMDGVEKQLEAGMAPHRVEVDYRKHIVFKVPHVHPEDRKTTVKRLKNISPFNVRCALKRAEAKSKNTQIQPVHDWIDENLKDDDLGMRRTTHRLTVIASWIGEPCGYPRKLLASGVKLVDLT